MRCRSRRRSTDERKARGPRGPLHGIPVLIKDNIDTADRMTTTAGSLALEGSIAAQDAFVAEQTARGRRDDSRQNESQRVGEFSLDAFVERMERARRTDEQSIRARPESVRIELRLRRRRSPRISAPSASARRPTARSSARPRQRHSSASSRRSAWSAGRESFRSRTVRTPPARWRARSRTRRFCSTRSLASIRAIPRRGSQRQIVGRLHALPRRERIARARELASRENSSATATTTDKLIERGDRGDEATRRDHRRSREHPDRRASSTTREFEVLLYEFKADLNAYLASLGAERAGAVARRTSSRSTRRNKDREMP